MKTMKFAVVTGLLFLAASSALGVSEGLEDGSNNSSSGAVSFSVPDTLTGSLTNDGGSPQPLDYFTFNAIGGQQYNVVATMSGDVDVDIENTSTIIASGFSAGNENFNFTPASSGTHYVVVYGAINPFTYNVTVSQVSGVNDWELY